MHCQRQKHCRDPGSNRGPLDLQSNALPTELSRRCSLQTRKLLDCFYFAAHNGRQFDRVFESANSLAKSIGMEECGQMAICDAHARYSDYGLLALPLVLLFPG